MAEALKGRKAIQRGTLEEFEERGKWIVRWKDLDGVPREKQFDSVDESHLFFCGLLDATRTAKGKG